MTSRTRQAQEPDAPLPKTLFGYEVIQRLGEGAASAIYAVSDPESTQVYALKHVVCQTKRDLRYIAQLQTEFEVSRNFRHPGLRRSVDLKLSRTLLRRITEAALVMELVDGMPLDRQKPQDLATIIDCFAQVARAVSAMHSQSYIHCDIKPNNIIADGSGHVKLIDFGQTCRTGTVKERIQGTPDFIAPEQVKLRPVTFRTDVYCFGATLYWALCGQHMPTLFTVPKDKRDIVLQCKFPRPRQINDNIPEALSELAMECVQVDPLKRPGSMIDVLDRLRGTHG